MEYMNSGSICEILVKDGAYWVCPLHVSEIFCYNILLMMHKGMTRFNLADFVCFLMHDDRRYDIMVLNVIFTFCSRIL